VGWLPFNSRHAKTIIVVHVARPIAPTPILRGADAQEFIKATLEAEQKPDPRKARFLQECMRIYLSHQ